MPSSPFTLCLRLAGALALLAAAPAWAAANMSRAEAECTYAAMQANLAVTGVESVRDGGGDTVEVLLRMASGPSALCRFDQRTGFTSFPETRPGATGGATTAGATARAAQACTAAARQQGIPVGELESVQPVGGGSYEVHYARPYLGIFGKSQTCRYDAARGTATFGGGGSAPAATDPAVAQQAGELCLSLARARGKTNSEVVSVKPLGGGLHEVVIRLGRNPGDPTERCRYNEQTRRIERI
jgi:hypothetical protein